MQKRLYDAFEGSAAKTDVEAVVKGAGGAGVGGGAEGGSGGGTAHVFQALQYLRKLCSHPRLVTPPDDKNKSKSKSAGRASARASRRRTRPSSAR